MNEHGKSDGPIVPGKRPNKGGETLLAEDVEERQLTKGNALDTAASRTQGRKNALITLQRVRIVAHKERSGGTLFRQIPKVGAVCGNSARTDLCGVYSDN